MHITEKQLTQERLSALNKPFALIGEYRGGHDLRKFTMFRGFDDPEDAKAEALEIGSGQHFADGQGGKRGYRYFTWRVQNINSGNVIFEGRGGWWPEARAELEKMK